MEQKAPYSPVTPTMARTSRTVHATLDNEGEMSSDGVTQEKCMEARGAGHEVNDKKNEEGRTANEFNDKKNEEVGKGKKKKYCVDIYGPPRGRSCY